MEPPRAGCPDPQALAAYAEQAGPSGRWDAHLSDCPACRRDLDLLHEALRGGARPGLRWAAAAAVLLIGALALKLLQPAPGPAPAAAPLPSTPDREPFLAETPGTALASGDRPRAWALEGAGLLALAPGSRLSFTPEGASLEAGALWMDAGARRIRTPAGTLGFQRAEIALRLEPSGALSSLWLGSAFAEAAPALEAICLGGRIETPIPVEAGERLLLEPGKPPRKAPLDAAARERLLGWRSALGSVRVLKGADLKALRVEGGTAVPAAEGLLLSSPGRMRMILPEVGAGDGEVEVLLRASKAGGDLGLAVRGAYCTSPVSGLGQGWTRLSASRRGGRVLFRLDGRLLGASSGAGSQEQEPGLLLWGASVEVRELSVRAWSLERRP